MFYVSQYELWKHNNSLHSLVGTVHLCSVYFGQEEISHKVYGNPQSYVKSEYVLLITLNQDQLVLHLKEHIKQATPVICSTNLFIINQCVKFCSVAYFIYFFPYNTIETYKVCLKGNLLSSKRFHLNLLGSVAWPYIRPTFLYFFVCCKDVIGFL